MECCKCMGLFYCEDCGNEWAEVIPPLWLEWWPMCCGVAAYLIVPLVPLFSG